MPYFIELVDGSFQLVEGELVAEELGDNVVAAYVVSQKLSRAMTFKTEDLAPKKERRFRCRDGQLRLKAEMSADDLEFLNEKMAKARAARKAPQA